MLNSCNLQGRITRDAETKVVGKSNVTTFGIANETGFGERKKTSFFEIEVWGKEGLKPYLLKGKEILVSGEIVQDRWTTQDGKNASKFKLTAFNVSFTSNQSKATESEGEVSGNPDIIPF